MSASGWSALFTGVAAIAALVYVELTRRLWIETAKQRETGLMLKLMMEYDRLRGSIQTLLDWFARHGDTAVEEFRNTRMKPNSEGARLDPHRFRVSRFFVKIRKLSRHGYLREDLIRATLDADAVRLFLLRVDTLDEVVSEGHNKPFKTADREFFADLLTRYEE